MKFKVIRPATPCLTKTIKIMPGYEKFIIYDNIFLEYCGTKFVTCLNHMRVRLKRRVRLLKNLKPQKACFLCRIFFYCLAGTLSFQYCSPLPSKLYLKTKVLPFLC